MAERVPRPLGSSLPPPPGPSIDGVMIVAVIHYSQDISKPSELLLVHQFRPPVNAHVVEFTAGLVDAGESIEAAARRELKEEVGYTDVTVVDSCTRHRGVPMDPGMSNSCLAMVHVEVDGSDPSNRPSSLHATPEDGEEISVLRIPIPELHGALALLEQERGFLIDIAVASYAAGLFGRGTQT